MELIRTRDIRLMWDGDQICALIGTDLVAGCVGFGSTVPEALDDLLSALKKREITVWVPHNGKQFIENGALKTKCLECGLVRTFTSLDAVYMYICNGCGESVELDPIPK